jgi:hypothetical protein
MITATRERVKTPEDGGWRTPAEQARRLTQRFGRAIPLRSVHQWAASGALASVKLGGRVYIHDTDLDAFIQRRGAVEQRMIG